MYGVLENQFRRYFKEADRIKGITGENLLVLLERRLDNVVYRLGFAGSRNEARQWVRHSHVLVNGKAVNVPSFLVRPGDVIAIKDKSRKISFISEALDAVERLGVPPWLEVSKNDFQGKVTSLPERKDITMPVQEQLIVELFSR
jgi:small subunit ribosomal protein S4